MSEHTPLKEDYTIRDPDDERVRFALTYAQRCFSPEVELSAAHNTQTGQSTITIESGDFEGRVFDMVRTRVDPEQGLATYSFYRSDNSPL